MPVAKPRSIKKPKRGMLSKAVAAMGAMDGSGKGKGLGVGRRNAVAKCRNPKNRKKKQ